MTSPYRTPASPPERSRRFVRALVGAFGLRVLLARDRVVIDALDFHVLFVIGVCGTVGVPVLLAMPWWSALSTCVGLGAAMFGARVHLRVRAGRALLVRTVLFVPWWISFRDVRAAEVAWSDGDLEDTELVVPCRSLFCDPDKQTLVLSTVCHDVTHAEIEEIDAEIRRVLGG